MARKTLTVEDIKEEVNSMLRVSTCTAATRQGMINVLEFALHSTKNYRGFRYLLAEQVPEGCLPGVNYEKNIDGNMLPCADVGERFANTDPTRVQYY